MARKNYKKNKPVSFDHITEIVGKIPPQNVEAEKSLLGSLLIDKNAIIKIYDYIRPNDFYREVHAMIYEAMGKLYEKKMPIDLVTLTDVLEREKKLEEIGGASYLANLANSVPTASHVVNYADIISQKSVLRRLIDAAQNIAQLGYREADDVDTLLDTSERILFDVTQQYLKQEFVSLKDILSDTFERIDELHKNKGQLRGIPTGFDDIDNLLAGLQPSDLIIIASRPSMGKTTLALNMAANVAIKSKLPVGIFSLEMSKEQLVDRMLCSQAGVDSWKLRTGNLDDSDFPKIGYAMGVLSEAPLFIDDSPVLNVMEIRTRARKLKSDHDLALIVVDYLQLIQGKNFSADYNRVQEISEISRGLKALARELNVPVVCCSQLSRAVEMRPNHTPQLADLRESGSIEQDADVVAFIYREEYYDKDTEKKNIADIMVKKHRNGPTGDIELYFAPDQLAFKNLEKKRKEKVS
jgi:replicative DNA helicase